MRPAVGTGAAGMAEPGNADAPSGPERRHAVAGPVDDADDLVTGHDRQTRIRQLAVDDVQVGPADAAGLDADQDLTGSPAAGPAELPS